MILHFPIQKLVWVFNRRFSTTFVLVDLLGKNEWTVREALPWVFKPFSFSIWYSTIFTPLIILSIVHRRLFNKFNCTRDPRTFLSHALRLASPHTSDISSMDPLTVRPFISLDMISLKACKGTIRSTEVYLTRHLQTITHLLSTQSYSRFHFCTNRYLNRQNWSTFFHQLKIFMSNHFMISPFQNPIFSFESVLVMGYRLFSLINCSILNADIPYSSGAIRTSFDFILGCSPRVNEESESRWIIRFCFIKLEEKPFHSFHSSSNRERRKSEIMIDYLSKKYNYMLQNGGKYHCHNQYHLSCGFEDRRWVELHRGGQKEVKRRPKQDWLNESNGKNYF